MARRKSITARVATTAAKGAVNALTAASTDREEIGPETTASGRSKFLVLLGVVLVVLGPVLTPPPPAFLGTGVRVAWFAVALGVLPLWAASAVARRAYASRRKEMACVKDAGGTRKVAEHALRSHRVAVKVIATAVIVTAALYGTGLVTTHLISAPLVAAWAYWLGQYAGLIAYVSLLTTSFRAARSYADAVASREGTIAGHADWIAAVLGTGVRPSDLVDRMQIEGDTITVAVPPVALARTADQIETTLARVNPAYVAEDSNAADGTVTFRAAGSEDTVARTIRALSDGIFTGTFVTRTPQTSAPDAAGPGSGAGAPAETPEHSDDGSAPEETSRSSLRAARRRRQELLAAGTPAAEFRFDIDARSDAVAPQAAAVVERLAREGVVPGLTKDHTLTRIDAARGFAYVTVLTDRDRAIRDRIADGIKSGLDPRQVDVEVVWVRDDETGAERPETVTLVRWPIPSNPVSRFEMLRNLTRSAIPGWAGEGWTVHDEPTTGRAVLTYGKPPRLPDMVPLGDVLPAQFDAEGWDSLPIGIHADGRTALVDLALGPHMLVVGPTGSGKTVLLLASISSALSRGHGLVLIDPTKAGVDFAAIRPWATAWATGSLAEAAATLKRVYAEATRRKKVLVNLGHVKWSDLDDDERAAHNIAPLTVLIDEFGTLALDEAVPKGLDKEDPLVLEAVEANAHKAVIKSLVGKIAREARFVGIHLEIALQRPDVAVMGSGELRSNLTSTVQLVKPGSAPSRTSLAMVFPAEQVETAEEQVTLLDDGKSRGLAVIGAEGGSAKGLRVAYTPMREIPALLDARGVPRVPADQVWDVSGRAVRVPVTEGAVIDTPVRDEVIDHGEIVLDDLDLSDIDLTEPTDDDLAAWDDEPEVAPQPTPAPNQRPLLF